MTFGPLISCIDTSGSQWTLHPFAGKGELVNTYTNGTAQEVQFSDPTGILVHNNHLYVTDRSNHIIRRIALHATKTCAPEIDAQFETIAGIPAQPAFAQDNGAQATESNLNHPDSIVISPIDGSIFVADTGNHRVRRISDDGTIVTILGLGIESNTGDGTPATDFPVNTPRGMAMDTHGNLYVAAKDTIRQVIAHNDGTIDGTNSVHTIHGKYPLTFPETSTRCLTAVAMESPSSLQAVDSCNGFWISIDRQ